MSNPELNIVIPVYNEQDAIVNVLDKWSKELDRLQIVYQIHVYNDGSKDNTLNVLSEFADSKDRIVVHDKPNSGHGPTILKGYRENCNATWLFQIDSDDEMLPDSFEELWSRRNDFDFLIGTRKDRKSPLPRKLISLVSRLTVWALYGAGVYDVNSPYRLMKTELYKDYYFKIPEFTFAPNVIISGITGMNKYRVFETGVKYQFRTTGEVSIKKWKLFKAALKSFMQTITCRFKL